MKSAVAAAAVLALAPLAVPAATWAAEPTVHYNPIPPMPAAAGMPAGPANFSSTVMAGNTLYVSGTTDGGTRLGGTAEEASRRVMNNIKRSVEAAGLTMNDLVWVQIFATDLTTYQVFNDVYRSYFTGPLPARAFIGTSQLLGGARFEVMGIAVKGPRK